MTSAQKIISNRANAKASAGPRTVHGKARAARNPRRHGLSAAVISDVVLSKRAKVLAQKIAGKSINDETCQFARLISEAQLDLLRVRNARVQFVLHEMKADDPSGLPKIGAISDRLQRNVQKLLTIDRYERRALSRRKFAIRAYDAARKIVK